MLRVWLVLRLIGAAGALALGLGAQAGLTVSLVKRGRDLLLGLPAPLTWQLLEGRRLLSRGP